MTPRWGKVAEGSTTTDWDEEEIARKISIQTGLSYAEWPATPTTPSGSSERVKINLIDLPGYSTFITETKASLIAADAALITVDAHVGRRSLPKKSGIIARNTTFRGRSCSPGWTASSPVRTLDGIAGAGFRAQRRGICQLPIGAEEDSAGNRSGGHEGPHLQARWRRQALD